MYAWIALAWIVAGESPRHIAGGPEITLQGGPSRDGKWLSYADAATGALVIRDLSTGVRRIVAAPESGAGEYAYFSVFSPDGLRIAYAWMNRDGFYELRVAKLAGGAPVTLFRNPEAGFVQPCSWSPDGNEILTLFFRNDNTSQIALVPSAGGKPRVLRSLAWVYPKRMEISPDGKWIVYDSFAQEGASDRTIFALAIDGSSEKRLVTQPGNFLFPSWMPDGKSVVFAGDIDGEMKAWRLAVADGKPAGEPQLILGQMRRALPLGVTSAGDWIVGSREGGSDVFLLKPGAPASDARRVTLKYPLRNRAPAWSADGKRLAYLSRRGAENFGQEARAIVVRDLGSDAEREIAPKLSHIERVIWSPKGDRLLVSGSDGNGRGGLFFVGLDGETQPFVDEAGAPFRGYEAVWPGDGSRVYYLRGGELRERAVATGEERVVWKGKGLAGLAASPDGGQIAIGERGHSVVLVNGSPRVERLTTVDGVTEIAWGRELYIGRGSRLWRVGEDASMEEIAMPGNRIAGVAASPDGSMLAVTAGRTTGEIWSIRLGR